MRTLLSTRFGNLTVLGVPLLLGTACSGAAPDVENLGTNVSKAVLAPQTPLLAANIPKFVDAVTTFSGRRINGTATVNANMQEVQQRVLPASIYSALPAPYNRGTYVWAYNINGLGASWPATTIEAKRGTSTSANYSNSLSNTHLQSLLTYDQTIHWADPLGTTKANNCRNGPPLAPACLQPYTGPIPATVHLHGAEVLSASDGHPDSWFTPGAAIKGPGFITTGYNYPNSQEATMLWFHDHALGVVRENLYAGLAGMYIIRDDRDTGLTSNPITLPGGNLEQEFIIQDRQFDTNGQLLFPDGTPADNPTGLNGPPPNPDVHPFWIPEFFGDVMTVNGKSWPYFNVQPRRYRFRILNGSNARFINVQMLDQSNNAGPAIWQIGSDGGLFDKPVKLDDPAGGPHLCENLAADTTAGNKCLFLAPAERADVIIDFAGQTGKTFTLKNFAVFPFPSGGPVDPSADGLVMQFRVNQPLSGTDTSFNPAASHPALRAAPIVDIKPPDTGKVPDKIRQLILVEVEGAGGPEEVMLNNSHWDGNREGTTTPIAGSTSNGHGISATEVPQEGSTEVWEIANLTEDAHPIHLHLIQFQVISRQAFDVDSYRADWDALFPGGTFKGITYPAGTFIPGYGPPLNYNTRNSAGAIGGNQNFDVAKYLLQGTCAGGACPVTPPDPLDSGWKDTIKVFPGAITRIATRWAPQSVAVNGVSAGQDLFPFDPTTGGPGYVWHCHIVDHEDNEMMRPLLIGK